MQEPLSVTQLVTILNDTLELSFPRLEVRGEVAGFKVWQGRLAFFDLKDEDSSINCMLPLARMDSPLEDGMEVRIVAGPKVTKKGRLSITVLQAEPAGEGAIKRAFELLKRKLEAEGLFAPERKRSLVEFPRSIGVITSLESAAYQDFIKILNQRWSGVEVVAYHSQVQGAAAPQQLIAGIEYFNQLPRPVDVLVLTRGGGSLEDLAAFNTEPLARAVAASRAPIVVGVGHETDTSLADLVADKRAVTPTDAARLVVPEREEVRSRLEHSQQRVEQAIRGLLEREQHTLSRYLGVVLRSVSAPQERVENLHHRLLRSGEEYLLHIRRWREKVEALRNRTYSAQRRTIDYRHQQLAYLHRYLVSLNPETALRRGYAIARLGGQVVKSAASVSAGDELVIQLANGSVNTEVKNVETE